MLVKKIQGNRRDDEIERKMFPRVKKRKEKNNSWENISKYSTLPKKL